MATPTRISHTIDEASTAKSPSSRSVIETKENPRPRAAHRPGVQRTFAEIPIPYRRAMGRCCDGKASWPVLLSGPTGTGKTCAALVLCDHIRVSALFTTFAALCEDLIEAMSGNLKEESRRFSKDSIITPRTWWERWANYGLCVIDEIGHRGTVSDFKRETMQRCLDSREGKPLLMTANLGTEQLADLYGDRIASRLEGGTYVWLEAEDRRVN